MSQFEKISHTDVRLFHFSIKCKILIYKCWMKFQSRWNQYTVSPSAFHIHVFQLLNWSAPVVNPWLALGKLKSPTKRYSLPHPSDRLQFWIRCECILQLSVLEIDPRLCIYYKVSEKIIWNGFEKTYSFPLGSRFLCTDFVQFICYCKILYCLFPFHLKICRTIALLLLDDLHFL